MEQDKNKDLAFLEEMKDRLERGRNGDPTQLDYLAQMIGDWIYELKISTVEVW